MATYPQSQAYGHMPYPTQTYPQQPLPPPNYYPPPPPPQHVYYADPNYFRRDYVARLSELTVNSRPIIQTLSMTAQEYVRYADIVVNCLEQHIRRVSHPFYLPFSPLHVRAFLWITSKLSEDPPTSRLFPCSSDSHVTSSVSGMSKRHAGLSGFARRLRWCRSSECFLCICAHVGFCCLTMLSLV